MEQTQLTDARSTLDRYAGILSAAYPQLTSAINVVQGALDDSAEPGPDAVRATAQAFVNALDSGPEPLALPSPASERLGALRSALRDTR